MSLRTLAALSLGSPALAIDNGLGLTPPMGWRSWNCYHGDVDQEKMESIMTHVASRGRLVDGINMSLADVGYVDVGLDDNWQACGAGVNKSFHDAEGRPIINLKKFPDMKKMTDYAHSLGLTAGWYMNNCICNEHMFKTKEYIAKHMEMSAKAVAEYGFDGVKLDGCGEFLNLTWWAELLNATGRPIIIENCHWGGTTPGTHPAGEDEALPNDLLESKGLSVQLGGPAQIDGQCSGTTMPSDCPYNFFRTSGDITNNWGSMWRNLQTTLPYLGNPPLARPGTWAYPDMLEVGRLASFEEDRSHFGAWVITSSPLILGHDLNDEKVTDKIWDIITNREAIAINQAWAGHPGRLVKTEAAENGQAMTQVWAKPIGGAKMAVFVINNDAKGEHAVAVSFDDLDLEFRGRAHVRCLWGKKDLGEFSASYQTDSIGPHDSRLLVLSPTLEAEVVV
jgi:alpha-galactosidase